MGAKQSIGRITDSSISAPFLELHQALTSRPVAISPFLDQLIRSIRFVMGNFGAAKKDEDVIEMALGEALAHVAFVGGEWSARHLLHKGRRLAWHLASMGSECVGQSMKGGHFFPEENPDDTAAVLSRFLKT